MSRKFPVSGFRFSAESDFGSGELKTQNSKLKTNHGFTLIEMMVSVALFAIVMLIAGATLLSLVYANRKAQALQSVINNLNVSLDGMVRDIREGSNYNGSTNCVGGNQGGGQDDCTGGGQSITFTPFGADPKNPAEQITYFVGGACVTGRLCISENVDGQPVIVPITSQEVDIQSMVFYVVGTTPASQGGTQQSKVVFTIKGQAGLQAAASSTFDIQATAVQRELNL